MNKLKDIKTLCVIVAIIIASVFSLFVKDKSENYSIDGKKYLAPGTNAIASNYLLHDVTYYGETGTYTLVDNFNSATPIYSDASYTFSNLPYKFINSEMFKLPNADKSLINSSLFTFTVYRAVDIYILRDNRITTNPTWLSDYTNTNETITSSNDVTYNIWKMSVSANSSGTQITIGSNIDSADDLNGASNQIVFVKETSKVANRSFFYYDFEGITADEITYGFSKYAGTNFTVAGASITDDDSETRNGLLFVDNDTSNIVYIQKYFAPLTTDFVVEFKAYVTFDSSITSKNTWLRMWLSNEKPSSDSDKTKLLAETYLNRNGTSLDVKIQDGSNTAYNIATGLTFGKWHTYKYEFDMTNRTYTVYIDGVKGTGARNGYIGSTSLFRNSGVSSTNYIIFGSGKSTKSYFAIDDVKVYPLMGIGATGMTVDGNEITFDKDTNSYTIVSSNTSSTATYSIAKTSEYYSHTITYPADDVAHVVVTNNNMETYAFDINFTSASILLGIDVRGDGTGVTAERIGNAQAIHILDTSTTNLSYIEKSFTPISTAVSFSYDVYFPDSTTNNVDNTLLKSFLTNGQMVSNYSDLSIVASNAYLNPIGVTTDIGNKAVATTTLDDTTVITKETWHNIKYELDLVDQKYDVYLDDTLVISDFDTYNNITSVSNLVIGSDYAGTADYYIKNIEVSEMSGAPINGVTVDGVSLPNFNKNNSTYDFYTDQVLRSTTNVVLSYNAFYKENTTNITLDTTNEVITIEVQDNLSNTITYTITYVNPIDKAITLQDLTALYNRAVTLSESSSTYTEYTWNKVSSAMTSANTVINDVSSITTDYALAYYVLESAINGLQQYESYDETDAIDISETKSNPTATFQSTCKNGDTVVRESVHYEVSLVSTIEYSSALDGAFSFEKVLENGASVYKEGDGRETPPTFTSVPYKYMNAEYILIKNQVYTNSSYKFTTNQSIHLLIFKDWNSGPFNKTITVNNTTYSFADTGEIATSSDGTIYKIYQTVNSIPASSTVEIESNNLITSLTTTNNSIVGFIKANNANNTYFFNEDMDDYASTTEFSKSWDNIISCATTHSGSVGSYNNIITDATDNYLKQYSNGDTEMPIIFKRFAKLYEKIEFKYTAYVDNNGNTISNSHNKWLRTWLTNFDIDITSGRAISTGGEDKAKALVDIYIGDGNMLYNYDNKTDNTILSDFTTTVNTWYDYVFTYDIVAQTFELQVYPHGSSTSICSALASGTCTPTNNTFFNKNTAHNNSANYAYFTGRGSQDSLSRLSQVTVTPISSNMYSDLNVDGNSIGTNRYQDLTKAYLYKYDPSVTNNLTVTTTNGTLGTTSETINQYPSSSSQNSMTYATVTSANTTGSLNRNYTIYFEADENNKKIDLADLLDTAYALNRIEYTTESYADLITAMTAAEDSFENHKIIETDVQTLIDNLQTALDNLEKLVDFKINYKGKIKEDYRYSNFDASVANITTTSSFTAHFTLNARTSTDGYIYNGQTHSKYITTDCTYPENTKITLIDRSYSTPKYYYYVITSSDVTSSKTKYLLNDFHEMGTTDKHYSSTPNYNATTRVLYGDYYVIVDFKDTVTPMATGTHSIKFELDVEGEQVSTSDELEFSVYNLTNRITLNASFDQKYYTAESTGKLNVEVDVYPIVSDGITVIDTNIDDLRSSLKFSLYDSTGTTRYFFGKGMIINDGTKSYYMDNDNSIRIFNNLAITSFSRNYDLYPEYDKLPLGTFSIRVDYLGTFGSVNDANILATEYETFEVREEPTCSIYASVANGEGFVDRSINNAFDTTVRVKCVGVSDDRDVTLTVYKKNNNIFSNFNYDIVDMNNVINNTYNFPKYSTMPYTYLIRHAAYDNNLDTDHSDTLTGYIRTTLDKGTYKAVYDVRYGNKISSDFYTFYVK